MQTTTENQKGFLGNDRKLVCSMFVFYGLCILGAIIATLWGLDRRNKTISANATTTAIALGTERANVTATAVARTTEQAGYSLINRFDKNNFTWRQGTEENEYWSGYVAFESGVYVWDVKDVKDGFVSWAEFPTNEYIHDFDVYVDTKITKGEPGAVCSGLFFRMSPEVSQKDEHYYFSLCNDSRVKISYYTGKDGWENITSLPYLSYSNDWNRLEISARASHFVFSINGNKLYEMDDDRRNVGGLALVVELNEKTPARIIFDNFGVQYR